MVLQQHLKQLTTLMVLSSKIISKKVNAEILFLAKLLTPWINHMTHCNLLSSNLKLRSRSRI